MNSVNAFVGLLIALITISAALAPSVQKYFESKDVDLDFEFIDRIEGYSFLVSNESSRPAFVGNMNILIKGERYTYLRTLKSVSLDSIVVSRKYIPERSMSNLVFQYSDEPDVTSLDVDGTFVRHGILPLDNTEMKRKKLLHIRQVITELEQQVDVSRGWLSKVKREFTKNNKVYIHISYDYFGGSRSVYMSNFSGRYMGSGHADENWFLSGIISDLRDWLNDLKHKYELDLVGHN